MNKIKLFIILSGCLFFLIPKIARAEEYKIHSVIIVPQNWQTQATPKLNDYKVGTNKAMSELQEWYKSKLNGKTFQFDSNVTVLNLDIPAPIYQKGDDMCKMFREIGGTKLLPPKIGTIYVIWIFGGGERNPCSTLYKGERRVGYAFLRDIELDGILNYEEKTSREVIFNGGTYNIPVLQRHTALGILLHELTHSFNLLFAGNAKGHPCTQANKEWCIDVNKDLPGGEEYERTPLGHYTNHFPDFVFNNSSDNPEKIELYKSPFLNPQNDPPPPIEPTVTAGAITNKDIFALQPDQEVEITGKGFGNEQGEIKFKFTRSPILCITRCITELTDYKVVSWNDNSIKISLGKSEILPDPQVAVFVRNMLAHFNWNIYVQTKGQNLFRKLYSEQGFESMLATYIERKFEARTGLHVKATCEGGKPAAGAKFDLVVHQETVDSFEKALKEGKVLISVITDLNGEVTFDVPEETVKDVPVTFEYKIVYNYNKAGTDKRIVRSPSTQTTFELDKCPDLPKLDVSQPSAFEDVKTLLISSSLGSEEGAKTYDSSDPVVDLTDYGDKDIYAQVVDSKGLQVFQVHLDPDQTIQIGDFKLVRRSEEITKVYFNDKLLFDKDNPDDGSETAIHLADNATDGQEFQLPVRIIYASGREDYGAYKITYKPEESSEGSDSVTPQLNENDKVDFSDQNETEESLTQKCKSNEDCPDLPAYCQAGITRQCVGGDCDPSNPDADNTGCVRSCEINEENPLNCKTEDENNP